MKKISIILADENQSSLAELSRNFTEEKFEILASTTSGEELIDLINKFNPDIVIMDIVLQKCDGFKVLEKVKDSNTKIIVHSSLSMDGFINKAISLGAKYYCIKPFNADTLKERIEDILNPSQTQNKSFSKAANQIEEKITNIFITVGIPAHIKGYQFLREAIKLAIANPEIINSLANISITQITPAQ